MVFSKRKSIGTSGIGIVIAIILIGASFWAGSYLASGDSGQGGGFPGMPMGPTTPSVNVIKVESSYIDIPIEYIGYVEAMETVDLIPQVSGYLDSVNFEEGAYVKKGDVLFEIEKQQYEATLNLRKAELAKAKATFDQAEKLYKRLSSADKRSISQVDLDDAASAVATGKAAIEQCKASIVLAEIDIARTSIIAPIDGYIGKALVTEGNYVSDSSNTLARIVKTDPVRVVFSLSDTDYLALADKLSKDVLDMSLKLPNGVEIDGSGTFDFEDNQIDQGTASIALRVRFDNKDRKLIPGAYVNVLLTEKQRPEGIVIPHSAIMNTANGSMVYVVDAENKAQIRPVVTSQESQGGIIIESGLEVGDVIIVQGLQKVQPGIEVVTQM